MTTEGLRERTRRVVRAELSEAAQDLFLAHGFDATTVDQIAEAAGMSKRSFFRYFASKEDVVLDKYELLGDELYDALAARPPDEPAWDALRRAFDYVVDYYSDPRRRERAAMMQALVTSSPTLQARYLQKWEGVQARLAELLQQRAAHRGEPADRLIARATIDAATSCLSGAVADVLTTGNIDDLANTLDRVMNALRPLATPRPAARPKQ